MSHRIIRARCEECGVYLGVSQAHGGSQMRYCSSACRQRAYRERKAISAKLKAMPRWARAAGKRPIMPDGRPASTTDPSTWNPYDRVVSGAGDGLGIMLGDGLACYDIDHCLGKDQLPELLARVREPIIFAEISVSGTGLHIFVRSHAKSYKRDGIEFYSRARFIRMTGRRYRI